MGKQWLFFFKRPRSIYLELYAVPIIADWLLQCLYEDKSSWDGFRKKDYCGSVFKDKGSLRLLPVFHMGRKKHHVFVSLCARCFRQGRNVAPFFFFFFKLQLGQSQRPIFKFQEERSCQFVGIMQWGVMLSTCVCMCVCVCLAFNLKRSCYACSSQFLSTLYMCQCSPAVHLAVRPTPSLPFVKCVDVSAVSSLGYCVYRPCPVVHSV